MADNPTKEQTTEQVSLADLKRELSDLTKRVEALEAIAIDPEGADLEDEE